VNFDTSTPTLLGTGEVLTAPLSMGSHVVTLRVTDSLGETDTDNVVVDVVDSTPPLLTCPAGAAEECQEDASAILGLSMATADDRCDGQVAIQNDYTAGGPSASGRYPLGNTTVTFSSQDGSGNVASCETSVDVVDTTPPTLAVSVGSWILWPPNHRMVPVDAVVDSMDACQETVFVLASVVSSEPDDSPGVSDGRTLDDIQGVELETPDVGFLVRAERDGAGGGRFYTVTYRASDGSGNSTTAEARVVVPHDQGASPVALP